jgi:hypothetical protein
MLQNSHIPELMSTLDVSMNTNYSPQYHISRLYRDGQNYMSYGTFDNNVSQGLGLTAADVQKLKVQLLEKV